MTLFHLKGIPKQVGFVAAMALLLIGMGVVAACDALPGRVAPSTVTPTQALVDAAHTASASPTAGVSQTPSTTPTLTRTPTRTATPSPQPSATSTAVPTPSTAPTRTATPASSATARVSAPTVAPSVTPRTLPADHFWLERPIAPDGEDELSRWYAYASRADGSYPIHHGVEFVNPQGTPVRAVADGRIVVAGDDERVVYGARTHFYGLLIVQELATPLNGQPVYVLYGHLSEVGVMVGQEVRTGEGIGLVGMTGVAEGPHLHMEVRVGRNAYDATVNPELWLRPKEGLGVLAGLVVGPDGQPVTNEAKIMLARAAAPAQALYSLSTYPRTEVNSDPTWGENWAISELDAGDWVVQLYRAGRWYEQTVRVEAGKTTWLTLQLAQ